MAERARFITKVYDKYPGYNGRKAVNLFYEYRGREYIITDPNNGCMFDLVAEHKREQERIDRELEENKKPKEKWTYEGSAQQALDELYEYLEN